MVGGRSDRHRSFSESPGLWRRAVLRRKDTEVFRYADANPKPWAAQGYERHAKAFAESERLTEGESQGEAQVLTIANRDPEAVFPRNSFADTGLREESGDRFTW
jgi:hypothetical protein